jgi:hypothetical protein
LDGINLSIKKVNSRLNFKDSSHLGAGQFYKGQIIIDGITIEYTSYGITDGIVNVGT